MLSQRNRREATVRPVRRQAPAAWVSRTACRRWTESPAAAAGASGVARLVGMGEAGGVARLARCQSGWRGVPLSELHCSTSSTLRHWVKKPYYFMDHEEKL